MVSSLSVMPSVGLQPAGHLVRSIVKPAGPVTFLPSGEEPQPFDLIRATTAARSLAQRASQSSIEVGWAVAVAVPRWVDDVAPSSAADVAVVPSVLSPSSPPQAAAAPTRPASSTS